MPKPRVPIWMLDPASSRMLAANDAAEGLFGYSGDELRALTAFDLLDASEHERFRRVAQALEYWGDGGSWRCRMKDGTQFTITIRFHGVVQGGELALFMFPTSVVGHPTYSQPQGYRVARAGLAGH